MAFIGGIYAPNTPTLIGNLGVHHASTETALRALGQRLLGREKSLDALIVVSPHFVTGQGFGVVAQSQLRQIFDFYGFPPSFYDVHYAPPGAPEVAAKLVALSLDASIPVAVADEWGLDHGAWAPLIHLFPSADIPVVPLSICPELGNKTHEALGQQILLLAQDFDIALMATGSLVHRLDLWNRHLPSFPNEARQYLDMVEAAVLQGQWGPVWDIPVDLRNQAAPEGGELPLRVLAGALPSFQAQILAMEEEFAAASLTTVFFQPTI